MHAHYKKAKCQSKNQQFQLLQLANNQSETKQQSRDLSITLPIGSGQFNLKINSSINSIYIIIITVLNNDWIQLQDRAILRCLFVPSSPCSPCPSDYRAYAHHGEAPGRYRGIGYDNHSGARRRQPRCPPVPVLNAIHFRLSKERLVAIFRIRTCYHLHQGNGRCIKHAQ